MMQMFLNIAWNLNVLANINDWQYFCRFVTVQMILNITQNLNVLANINGWHFFLLPIG